MGNNRTWIFIGCVTLVILCIVPLVITTRYIMHLFNLAAIFAILTLGLNFLWGWTGLISFATAGFWGIGAYTAFWALLTRPPIWPRIFPMGINACWSWQGPWPQALHRREWRWEEHDAGDDYGALEAIGWKHRILGAEDRPDGDGGYRSNGNLLSSRRPENLPRSYCIGKP